MTSLLSSPVEVGRQLPPGSVVCVLGMHRSGTSMVSRFVKELGVHLGPDEQLMPPHEVDNPLGYWEHLPIVDLNDRLLAMFGGTWDRPPLLPAGWEHSSVVAGAREEARDVIAALAGTAPVIGWKDPRTSLLLPFWNTVLPVTTTLIVVRHPFQVAASLAERDGLDTEWAAHLWARYTTAAWLAHPHRAVISYEHALADPAGMTANIAAFLGLASPGAEILAELSAFATDDLNRQRDAAPPIGPHMTLALALHALLETQEFSLLDRVFAALDAEWHAAG